MIAFQPDHASPPGEFVAERLTELGLTPQAIVQAAPPGLVDDVDALLAGEVELTRPVAEVLHTLTGMPARLLLNLEATWQADRRRRLATCCRRCAEKARAGLDPVQQMRVFSGMLLCPDCGNKRCPRATDHTLDCSGSNQPGQPGSDY